MSEHSAYETQLIVRLSRYAALVASEQSPVSVGRIAQLADVSYTTASINLGAAHARGLIRRLSGKPFRYTAPSGGGPEPADSANAITED